MTHFSSLGKIFAAFFLTAASFLASSCSRDNAGIEIRLVSPTSGQVVANATAVPLNVEFLSSDGLHDIEVRVVRAADNDTAYLFEQHTHQQNYTHTHLLDLSTYTAGTEFSLVADAYLDEFGTDKVTREHRFFIP
jgi:hypothetical protein